MKRIVSIDFAEPESDLMFRVRCRVTAGTPDRGPDMACAGGYPGDPAEVEILTAEDEQGQDRPDVVALLESDFLGDIEAAALEEYGEVIHEEMQDAEEARSAARAEARHDAFTQQLVGILLP